MRTAGKKKRANAAALRSTPLSFISTWPAIMKRLKAEFIANASPVTRRRPAAGADVIVRPQQVQTVVKRDLRRGKRVLLEALRGRERGRSCVRRRG